MGISRRQLFGVMAGGTAVLLVPGCGGGGGNAIEPAGTSCGASGAAISLNHGHTLVIASSDLDSTVDMTYSIRGFADHDHTVTITAVQLRQMKAGGSIAAVASVSGAHSHVATAACTP